MDKMDIKQRNLVQKRKGSNHRQLSENPCKKTRHTLSEICQQFHRSITDHRNTIKRAVTEFNDYWRGNVTSARFNAFDNLRAEIAYLKKHIRADVEDDYDDLCLRTNCDCRILEEEAIYCLAADLLQCADWCNGISFDDTPFNNCHEKLNRLAVVCYRTPDGKCKRFPLGTSWCLVPDESECSLDLRWFTDKSGRWRAVWRLDDYETPFTGAGSAQLPITTSLIELRRFISVYCDYRVIWNGTPSKFKVGWYDNIGNPKPFPLDAKRRFAMAFLAGCIKKSSSNHSVAHINSIVNHIWIFARERY